MADFLSGVRHFFGSRNLYDALGVANDATGYLFLKHISSEKCRGCDLTKKYDNSVTVTENMYLCLAYSSFEMQS